MIEKSKNVPSSFYIIIPFTIWVGIWIYGSLASSKALLYQKISLQEVAIFIFSFLMAFYNLAGVIGLWWARCLGFSKGENTLSFLLSLGVSSIVMNAGMIFFLFLSPIASWDAVDLKGFLYTSALAGTFSAICFLNYKFTLKV